MVTLDSLRAGHEEGQEACDALLARSRQRSPISRDPHRARLKRGAASTATDSLFILRGRDGAAAGRRRSMPTLAGDAHLPSARSSRAASKPLRVFVGG